MNVRGGSNQPAENHGFLSGVRHRLSGARLAAILLSFLLAGNMLKTSQADLFLEITV